MKSNKSSICKVKSIEFIDFEFRNTICQSNKSMTNLRMFFDAAILHQKFVSPRAYFISMAAKI